QLPLDASAGEIQQALNDLRSIKPDKVYVLSTLTNQSFIYTVTFNSTRGDFDLLQYEILGGGNVTIEVVENTKGKPKLDTFTLILDGVLSRPISHTATATEVKAALEDLVSAKCPAHIVDYREGYAVKYFNNFEDDQTKTSLQGGQVTRNTDAFCGHSCAKNPTSLFGFANYHHSFSLSIYNQLCFAYKGFLQNYLLLSVSYMNEDEKFVKSVWFQYSFAQENRGILIEEFIVTQGGIENAVVHNQYAVTMVPIDCGYNIPLLHVGFAQAVSNGTKDQVVHRGSTWPEGTVIRVQRIEAASPPITGTFDLEIFGKSLKGLPVNSTASEMQYALQTVPEIGTVSVTKSGTCSAWQWRVKWLSNAGNQPALQVNDSNVSGVNVTVTVHNVQRGGLFSQRLTGDLFRTPHKQPQVEVFINDIPSNCSGNCGYKWNSEKTPIILGISPTTGSMAGGTVLTITGSRFANSSRTDTTWVSIGDSHCPITGLTDTEITCTIETASNTSSPLTVYIAGLGFAKHSGNQTFTFTFKKEVTSISPSLGSTEGGMILTISGCGFTPNSTVLIGGKTCPLLTESPVEKKCIVPAAPAGICNISLSADGISNTVPFSFTYVDTKFPTISQINPTTSSVAGGSNLTIHGSDFGNRSEGSFVSIGNFECPILRWSTNNITCRLPSLLPGNYRIYLQTPVSNSVNASIEYVLRVTGVTPRTGSVYGGSKITISGSGFSPVPDDNSVQIGSVPCHITFASPNLLECVLNSTGRNFVITNNGSNHTLGVGYNWNPSILDIFVGDTVRWQWKAPTLIQGLRYRVFSVSRPSDVNYKGSGFISGEAGTESGSFSYRFTSPGAFFYSSGYVDQKQSILLQGMVNVRPAEESSKRVHVYLAGIEAEYIP
ncbi:hypothetical protein scyTo_0019088, partial [Scyliorhinus torazame]|nr:hypothetical protein [Scyliorhinus torazame]